MAKQEFPVDGAAKPGNQYTPGYDIFKGTDKLVAQPVGGYHPMRYRMTIYAEDGTGTLVCDYDPAEFTEVHNMDWEATPVTGRGTTPIQFKTVNPREWSMKLFFNTLGDNQYTRSQSQERTVRDSLDLLRKMANPVYYGGGLSYTATSGANLRPPTLVVYLIDIAFRCVITKMSIIHKAIHPTSRIPTRAEVDISFTEYVESST